MKKLIKSTFVDHCKETATPQTYWEHLTFAWKNSTMMIIAALAGFVHGLIPALFPFSTARHVIKIFKNIVDSGRHAQDFHDLMPKGYLLKKHLKK